MEKGKNPDRRKFIRTMAMGTAGMLVLGSLESCKPEDPEMKVGTVADWEAKGELTGEFNGNSILVRKGKSGDPVIFSLTCTHKQCTVSWKPSAMQFQCPCHEGKYDAEGKVVSGPPPRPLIRYRHEVRDREIWVINEIIN